MPTLTDKTTPQQLAFFLDVHYSSIAKLFYNQARLELHYKTFEIDKRSGGVRKICAPKRYVKSLQRKITLLLEEIYKPRPSVHGFTKKRSILTGAKKHVSKNYVLNIDLENFFPSINFGRIRGLLIAEPYNLLPETATVIAQICCYQNCLPQGSPASPILSNMVCSRLDWELQNLASENKCSYTRYADDITFSFTNSKRNLPKDFIVSLAEYPEDKFKLGKKVVQIIKANNFKINDDKVRLQASHQSQKVTGITVNRFPNVNRSFVRKIRSMLHDWEVSGYKNASQRHFEMNQKDPTKSPFEATIQGKILYLHMIKGPHDPVYKILARRFNHLSLQLKVPEIRDNDESTANLYHTSRMSQKDKLTRQKAKDCTWTLEAAYDQDGDIRITQGTAFMLENIGLITCNHVIDGLDISKIDVFRANRATTKFKINLIYQNVLHDFAILKILDAPSEGFPSFRPGDSSKINEMDRVILHGYPNKKTHSSVHTIYAKITSKFIYEGEERFEIDKNIRQGNSGGPVLTQDSDVIGIAAKGSTIAIDKDTGNSIDVSENAVIQINTLLKFYTDHQNATQTPIPDVKT